jgi:predicted metal-dependent hydrolase
MGTGLRASSNTEGVTREAYGIPYRLRRSPRARRLRLVVDGGELPVLTLPHGLPVQVADAFVLERRAWIARHLARVAAERARHLARGPLGDGGALDLSGRAHRLEVRMLPAGRRSTVEHDDSDGPVLRVRLAPGDPRSLAVVLEAWLRRQARAAVERRIVARAPQLGVTPASIAIRDPRTRWGSASRRGRLSFSWRLVMAPPAVLDYVVVHELAHLAVFGHPPAFWALVRAQSPETDRARRWLRLHGRELHWALE